MTQPRHWRYYLSLEEDIVRASRYVEITKDNKNTYSVEFTRLLLAAGSEVDVVAKLLCEKINANARVGKISEYRPIIIGAIPNLYRMTLGIDGYSRDIRPWFSWGPSSEQSPDWWQAYNGVKHHRDEHYRDANLANVVLSVCGLYCLAACLYSTENRPYCPYFDRVGGLVQYFGAGETNGL